MVNETKKILDEGIKVSATCVRVPVFISHAESINIEFDSPLSDVEATKLLKDLLIEDSILLECSIGT